MIQKSKFLIVIIIVFALSFNCSPVIGSSQLSSWQKEFCSNLRKMATGELKYFSTDDSRLEMAASIIDSKTTMPAILELWIRERVNIDSFWWSHEDRATRCFIMALFPKAISFPKDRARPVFVGPDFEAYINRLNNEEKKKRNEEKKFVLDHLSAIAGLILKSLEKKNYKGDSVKYKLISDVYKENIGKPLP
ncbi:MAG: hypothetical protein GY845_11405 [Planctomycetes bacterium]|nr:hypothetical protein [Planctomycetota bacterium]